MNTTRNRVVFHLPHQMFSHPEKFKIFLLFTGSGPVNALKKQPVLRIHLSVKGVFLLTEAFLWVTLIISFH